IVVYHDLTSFPTRRSSDLQKDILDIRQRLDDDPSYPKMAARVAKAICLMEFAKTDLPRTSKNIAALLVQHMSEAPPVHAVTAILDRKSTRLNSSHQIISYA